MAADDDEGVELWRTGKAAKYLGIPRRQVSRLIGSEIQGGRGRPGRWAWVVADSVRAYRRKLHGDRAGGHTELS